MRKDYNYNTKKNQNNSKWTKQKLKKKNENFKDSISENLSNKIYTYRYLDKKDTKLE